MRDRKVGDKTYDVKAWTIQIAGFPADAPATRGDACAISNLLNDVLTSSILHPRDGIAEWVTATPIGNTIEIGANYGREIDNKDAMSFDLWIGEVETAINMVIKSLASYQPRYRDCQCFVVERHLHHGVF